MKPNRYWSGKRGEGEGIKFLRASVGYVGDDCLTWPLSVDDKGYGQLGFEGKRYKAHRLMCIFVKGESPTPKHQASHTCGNGDQGCVNPNHLVWKTNSQNQHDRRRHGKPLGNPYGRSGKLTAQQVAEIQAARGVTSIVKLAKQYGVKRGAIDYWHKKARLAAPVS